MKSVFCSYLFVDLEETAMKQKHVRTLNAKRILALAAAVLTLSAAAITPAAAEQKTDSAAAPDREPPETNAVTTGLEAKVHLDYAYNLVDASSEHMWVCLSDGAGKGFGCPWLALNLDKDIEFEGVEGAEVYVGTDGILRLALTDTASGDEVNPAELLYTSEEEPIDYTLTAEHYDWDLNLTDTTPLGNITERDPQVYFDTFDAAITSEAAAIGASRYGDATWLTAIAEEGDAVVYGLSGEELVRYPETDASSIFASISSDGQILVVSSFSPEMWTDIFTVGEDV